MYTDNAIPHRLHEIFDFTFFQCAKSVFPVNSSSTLAHWTSVFETYYQQRIHSQFVTSTVNLFPSSSVKPSLVYASVSDLTYESHSQAVVLDPTRELNASLTRGESSLGCGYRGPLEARSIQIAGLFGIVLDCPLR